MRPNAKGKAGQARLSVMAKSHYLCGDSYQRFVVLTHLMVPNRFVREGAECSAMWCIGQASRRTRWAELAHRRVLRPSGGVAPCL